MDSYNDTLKCGLKAVYIIGNAVILFTPSGHKTSMTGAIRIATLCCEKADRILVVAGNVQDTVYFKAPREDKWESRRIPEGRSAFKGKSADDIVAILTEVDRVRGE